MPQRIEVFLLPADPANRNLMVVNYGLSCFGGTPGYLLVEVWPGSGNITRLEPAVGSPAAWLRPDRR